MKVTDFKKQGKKNRASGQRFELRVRKDLESKGWIVAKWMNNVEFFEPCTRSNIDGDHPVNCKCYNGFHQGRLIPAKHKFRGIGIPMAIGTGFPDFIAFKFDSYDNLDLEENVYHIHGVEVKSNGYLTKEEKQKCKWLLDNNIFSKILVASKGDKRGQIKYIEFENA